ncbi:CocE/NonD family hydrolase [Paenibacillaceae bacterium]|nr:CocE/NonD family hydrolase [Paenibacillaceae bacterium]
MNFGGVAVERKAGCLMRDGVTLYADIYRPAGSGQYPVLLMRQPYGRMLASTVTYAHPIWFVHHGYVVIIQDVRGRGDSEGAFEPFVNDVNDGYDTVEWAAALPYANGKVGMYGFSYQGTTQWAAAAARPPHLMAIAPAMCAADLYHGMFYPHGRFAIGSFLPWAFQLARDEALRAGDGQSAHQCSLLMKNPDQQLWELPLLKKHPLLERYFPSYYEWCEHTSYDAYWEKRDLLPAIAGNPIPALHIGGWFDNYLDGTLQTFEMLQQQVTEYESRASGSPFHRLIIGPWVHIPWGRKAGGVDYGPGADGNLQMEHLRWFDYWLKNKRDEAAAEPLVKYYELESRQWLTADRLPPSRRRTAGMAAKALDLSKLQLAATLSPSSDGDEGRKLRWYLASDGRPANGAAGGGKLEQQRASGLRLDAYGTSAFVYDARLPMPCGSYLPQDRSSLQDRFEILSYTSDPLDDALSVMGAPMLSVWCQALEGPTDLVAVLSLVKATGEARFLSIGRAEVPAAAPPSVAHLAAEQRADAQPGAVDGWVLLNIPLRMFAARWSPGDAIRLELTGSAFPMFVRHPNGVESAKLPELGTEALQMAAVAVAHSAGFPSYLELNGKRWDEWNAHVEF